MNALTTARWGLTSAEHYYGLPEALFEDRVVQDFPLDYDYNDEYFRFSVSGQMFRQGAAPGSAKWNEVLESFLELGFTFVPTFTIYDANRDLMRARQADWHKEYTWKSMWDYFTPQRGGHGSYWYRWSTKNEVEWKENYRLWMAFINEYKNRGGRVCTGSDSGFIYQIFGFGYVRELELLQEAGFHPLEVIRSATSQGAALCGLQDELGTLEVGKYADLLVHDHNPADRLQASLRHRRDALQRGDQRRRMASRAQIHDQGRRDLRHRRAAGRRARAGQGKLRRGRPRQVRAAARGGAMTGAAGPEFVVLTGFLGTGKTTLLRDFLERPGDGGHGRDRERGRARSASTGRSCARAARTRPWSCCRTAASAARPAAISP